MRTQVPSMRNGNPRTAVARTRTSSGLPHRRRRRPPRRRPLNAQPRSALGNRSRRRKRRKRPRPARAAEATAFPTFPSTWSCMQPDAPPMAWCQRSYPPRIRALLHRGPCTDHRSGDRPQRAPQVGGAQPSSRRATRGGTRRRLCRSAPARPTAPAIRIGRPNRLALKLHHSRRIFARGARLLEQDRSRAPGTPPRCLRSYACA